MRIFLLLAVCGIFSVEAQTYPTKPVRIILTNPPGGTVDVLARTLSDELAKSFGQPFVIENRPGASGTLGAEIVAKSAPGGYTILQNSSGQALAPALFRTLPSIRSTILFR